MAAYCNDRGTASRCASHHNIDHWCGIIACDAVGFNSQVGVQETETVTHLISRKAPYVRFMWTCELASYDGEVVSNV